MKYLFYAFLLMMTACSSNRYFIVRHAEKTVLTKDSANMMMNNPPLSEAGKVRAFVLRDELINKHIGHIYSTNTIRSISTAEPLSQAKNIKIEFYNNADSLAGILKAIKGNVLIVGHSNTVDDIINKLCGKMKVPGDLKDFEYDNLFILKGKVGKMHFTRKKYGYTSNPE
jgi:broad specificity phosphatase PhoE